MSGGASLLIGGLFAGIGAGVGSLFGSPKIGAQVGFMVGGAIGSGMGNIETNIPQKLTLEKVGTQISTYGAVLPTVYGNARLPGNIIWASKVKQELTEDKSEYQATQSFALAICEGGIGGIRKMWADSILLFDQSLTTDLNSQLADGGYAKKMSFYDGTQTEPDPLIVSDLGEGYVPIYKNISYIVFTDLALAPYGNRVPNIEVEVAESAEIIEDISFENEGLLYPTSTEIYGGDIWVSYSEIEYKEDSLLYTTPKIKKMIGISAELDYEIEIDTETIRSFKFIDGIKIITCPMDFVLDIGDTGIENDITEYYSTLYRFDGLLVKKFKMSGRILSENSWFEERGYLTFTELNGFIAEDIEYIKDENWTEMGWLKAIMREWYYEDAEEPAIKTNGNGFILATGTKWYFDINNEVPERIEQQYIGELVGKEHLYSEPYLKLYDSTGEFLGEQSIIQTIDAMEGYKQLDLLELGNYNSTMVVDTPHLGYLQTTGMAEFYASGYRSLSCWYKEPVSTSEYIIPDGSILTNTNNNTFEVISTFFTTREDSETRIKYPMLTWLTNATLTDSDSSSVTFNESIEKQFITFYSGYYGFSMPNADKDSPPFIRDSDMGGKWDVTDIFGISEYAINMSKYLLGGKLHIILLSNLGKTKIIRESTWVYNGSGATAIESNWTGETYEVLNFEGFIANNVTISSIITDLMDTVGISSYNLTEIDDIEIGGYLRDKTVTAASMIKPLLQAFLFDILEVDWTLKAVLKKDTVDVVLDENYLNASENESKNTFVETLLDKNTLPNVAKITFIDISRDHKANTKTAQWIDRTVNEEFSLDLPFIISSYQAKQIAEKMLQFLWNTRSTFTFSSTIRYLYLMPNDVVTIGNKTLRITTVDFDVPNRLRFSAVEIRSGIFENESLTLPNPDSVDDPGSTLSDVSFILVHTHSVRKDNDSGYYVAVFSPKTWTGAAVYLGDTGQNMNLVATRSNESDVGILADEIEEAKSTTTFDYGTKITVVFFKTPDEIQTVSESAVLGFQNMIAVGIDTKWEIISYQTATDLGSNTWELSGLIRGINGTDIYNYSHPSGSYVIPFDSLLHIPIENSLLKKYLYMKVLPPVYGTTNTFTQKILALGYMLKVWGASDIIGIQYSSLSWVITWKYRTRVNGEWSDYTDIINIDDYTKFIVEFINPYDETISYKYNVTDLTTFIYTEEAQLADWGDYVSEIKVKIHQYNEYNTIESDSFSFTGIY